MGPLWQWGLGGAYPSAPFGTEEAGEATPATAARGAALGRNAGRAGAHGRPGERETVANPAAQ